MSKYEWQRADPDELAKFDPSTKVCTMNCGPAFGDPRSTAERMLLCDECDEERDYDREVLCQACGDILVNEP